MSALHDINYTGIKKITIITYCRCPLDLSAVKHYMVHYKDLFRNATAFPSPGSTNFPDKLHIEILSYDSNQKKKKEIITGKSKEYRSRCITPRSNRENLRKLQTK